MPLCVVDTSVLLPAFLSPKPYAFRRKLMAVFAYGALTLQEYEARDEVALFDEAAQQPEATVGGPTMNDFLASLERQRAAVAEVLPAGVPDDFWLVGSSALYDEVERKIHEKGKKLNPALPDDAPALIRRLVETMTGYLLPPLDLEAIPEHTLGRDRKDDYLVEMAVQSEAILVSDDFKHLTPDTPYTVYEDEARGVTVRAYRFDGFLDEYVHPHFDLAAVEPDTLKIALRAMPLVGSVE